MRRCNRSAGNQKIIDNLKHTFEESLGHKNLPEINVDTLRENLPTFLGYLSNIEGLDTKKKSLISLFILLKNLNKWEAFRRGEEMDLSQYMSDDLQQEVAPYLSDRKRLDIFKELPPDIEQKWIDALNKKSEAILIGESRGIIETLGEIERNYRDLQDPDNFSEDEKVLFDVIKQFGSRAVGKSLAQRFRDKSYEDEITKSLALDKVEDETKTLPVWQKVARILGAVDKFTDAVAKADLLVKVGELEQLLTPSGEIVNIFQKIGEEMSTASGVIPVNEDIEHLESILHKNQKDLSPDEVLVAQKYLDGVKEKVIQLNQIMDNLAKEFMVLHEASTKTEEMSERIKSRLQEFRKLFIANDSDRLITLKSTMTGDLTDVINHIRQCLACQTKEVNNDMNLTFGDRNRFIKRNGGGISYANICRCKRHTAETNKYC